MRDVNSRTAVILMAEDDAEDQDLTRRALQASKLRNQLMTVDDG